MADKLRVLDLFQRHSRFFVRARAHWRIRDGSVLRD